MSQPTRCPRCGGLLGLDAPHGLCPACLLAQAGAGSGLKPAGRTDRFTAQGPPTPGVTSPANVGQSATSFTSPTCEELAVHFPQLEILELLGQGGMGAVYKVRQKMLDRIVALKILPPESGRDAAFAERFTREARAMARLTHPHIVMVFEFGEADGLYYLIMEYVDGVNLRQAMQAGELTAAEALAIVPQICEALQFAHEEGIVHRDIKPENVLVDKRGRVKIADFGLAKLLRGATGDITLTATHQIMGTFRYMAPEQIEHPMQVDHRADIYSLGVVFYELLTGELPLGRFPLPSEKRSLDVRLDEVVLKTLERQPDLRYQHASDVKQAVETISRSAPVGPQHESPERPVMSPGKPSASPGKMAASASKPPVQPAPTAQPAPPRREPTVRVPFALNDMYGGLARAFGILRFDGRSLNLEFQVKDQVFGALTSDVKRVELPLEQLISIQLQTGFFRRRILIQCDDLQAVANVPRSERGLVTLHVEGTDVEAAEQLVAWVRQRLGLASEPVAAASIPIAAPPPQQPAELERVRRTLRAPALALTVVGCANLAPVIFSLFAFVLSTLIDSRRGNADAFGADGGSWGSIGLLPVWLVILLNGSLAAIFMVAGGLCLKDTRYRGLVVLGAIAALLPVSLLWPFSFPIAIWVLIASGRRDVAVAFAERRAARQRGGRTPTAGERGVQAGRHPLKESEMRPLLRRLRLPAIMLLAAGILNGAICFSLAILLVREYRSDVDLQFTVLGMVLLLAPGAVGSTLVFGAAHMLLGRWFAAARFAALLAVIPCTPAWLLSAPFGILALWRMSEPGSRRLFAG